jgi:ribosome-associated protein
MIFNFAWMASNLQNRDFSSEFSFVASRSGGAGGQHVNKVSSKVELRFHIANSNLLSPEEKERLLEKLGNKITSDGYLQIISQAERSQLLNKQLAIKKFYQLLEKSLVQPKHRKATKPTFAAVQERLQSKEKASRKKSIRGNKNFNDEL